MAKKPFNKKHLFVECDLYTKFRLYTIAARLAYKERDKFCIYVKRH